MIDTENGGFRGIWIPAELWLDENLTILERAIVADVLSFKSYYKSNDRMAKLFKVTERRLRQVLNSLEEKCVIVRVPVATESGRIKGRVIKLTQEYHTKLYPRPFPEEGGKKFPGERKKISGVEEENFLPYIENKYKNTKENTTASNSSSHSTVLGEKPEKEEEERRERKKYFQIPIYDEVAMYVKERGYQMDASEFFDFYEERGWKANGRPMKDWRKCCDMWERNEKAKSDYMDAVAQQMFDYITKEFDFEGAMRRERDSEEDS